MTTTPPVLSTTDRTAPVLIGDRLAAMRGDLSSGAVTLALILALGVVFLVAGLRPTTVTFTDQGEAYRAECGIETVLAGSSWDALDTACSASSGMRLLAAGGGLALLLGGLGQVAWLGSRRPSRSGPIRETLRTPRSRAAAIGALAAAVVAVGASLVARARLDGATLIGACGAGECPDREGLAGAVRLGALVALVALVIVAAWPLLRERSHAWRAGAGLVAAGAVLLLLAARPVTITADDDLRGTCGVEVLLAGHPQTSVTTACREAMAGRPVLGVVGLAVAIGGVVLLRTARTPPHGTPSTPDSVPSASSTHRRVRRARPLVAGEGE